MSDTKEYLEAEMEAIYKSKWWESQKARRDLSKDEHGRPHDGFYLSWVGEHAEDFRKAWNASICKDCAKKECRYQVLKECSNFIKLT